MLERAAAAVAADIGALTSPALAGRAAGSAGAARAAQRLAARLAALGWQPAGAQGWRDPVQVKGAWLRITPALRVGERRLRHRRDFAPLAGASGRFTGPLLPLGNGPVREEAIAGAVLLAADRPPRVSLAALAAAAAARGAVALLVEDGNAEWRRKGVAAEAHPLPVLALAGAVARELAGAAGLEISGIVDFDRRPRACANVVAALPGAPGAPIVALTAHYDHLGDDPDGIRFPGAFDNAAGVAALLATAARLASRPRLEVELLVAFLTGEESGLWGARRLAARGDLAALINVDGVGAEPRLARLRLGSADAEEPLVALALPLLAARGIEPVMTNGRDDSLAFRRAGIQTLGLGEEPRAGLPFLHTPDDLPERLHGAAVAACGTLVAELATTVALAGARGWRR
jgi:hypothetical protein